MAFSLLDAPDTKEAAEPPEAEHEGSEPTGDLKVRRARAASDVSGWGLKARRERARLTTNPLVSR